jgi:hypothetical protein
VEGRIPGRPEALMQQDCGKSGADNQALLNEDDDLIAAVSQRYGESGKNNAVLQLCRVREEGERGQGRMVIWGGGQGEFKVQVPNRGEWGQLQPKIFSWCTLEKQQVIQNPFTTPMFRCDEEVRKTVFIVSYRRRNCSLLSHDVCRGCRDGSRQLPSRIGLRSKRVKRATRKGSDGSISGNVSLHLPNLCTMD